MNRLSTSAQCRPSRWPAGIGQHGDDEEQHRSRDTPWRVRLSADRPYGHIKLRKDRTQFRTFCRYPRSSHPPQVRIAIVLDNFSPHRG